MKTGRVKFFNETKGFGFIEDDETKQEIFVHISELGKGVVLQQNDAVSYEVKPGKKGPNAVKVALL